VVVAFSWNEKIAWLKRRRLREGGGAGPASREEELAREILGWRGERDSLFEELLEEDELARAAAEFGDARILFNAREKEKGEALLQAFRDTREAREFLTRREFLEKLKAVNRAEKFALAERKARELRVPRGLKFLLTRDGKIILGAKELRFLKAVSDLRREFLRSAGR
jgi:hypothetical protein